MMTPSQAVATARTHDATTYTFCETAPAIWDENDEESPTGASSWHLRKLSDETEIEALPHHALCGTPTGADFRGAVLADRLETVCRGCAQAYLDPDSV